MFDSRAKEQMILELHEVHAIDFGKFKLKSGVLSPFYIDLRLLVSYPQLLELIADVLWQKLKLVSFDLLAGVPYAAVPMTTAISLRYNRPQIFVRKERKDHGKGKLIEGIFHKGQYVAIIDDVITDGASKFEVIKPLEEEGLVISQIVILLDRGAGGPFALEDAGYRCLSITTMSEVLDILMKNGRISTDQYQECKRFMERRPPAQSPQVSATK